MMPLSDLDHNTDSVLPVFASLQEAERNLPGSLTYRTYGYLMVAYAMEKQWGAAIELALVRYVL